MSERSTIEWTDATWNPVRGCSKVSAGCTHCYAETFAERWRGVRGHPYEQGFDPKLVPDKLVEPITWRRPRMIFVNSMSDLFHEQVPDEYIARVFGVTALADWHIYQVLTKRAVRMRSVVADRIPMVQTMRHVWLGVSVEDRRHGVPRIAQLQATPAAVRFLSIEPLLEDLGDIDLRGIDWLIVGGESGPGARPMELDWVLSIREQCKAARVPFFFKQWGGVHKGRTGRLLEDRTYDELPEHRRTSAPPREERERRLARASRELVGRT